VEVDLVDQAALERGSGVPIEGEKISRYLPEPGRTNSVMRR
jgi:hypothetical protein